MTRRKYFKTKEEAKKELERRRIECRGLQVFRMSKGTRHAGEFAVCTEMEWLNTY